GDFSRALQIISETNVQIVEISALREHELPPLAEAFPSLDLGQFSYISVHAPSKLSDISEREAVRLLDRILSLRNDIKIVVHPDSLADFDPWCHFRSSLL